MTGLDISVTDGPEYGETWVFEGIIGAIPGLELDPRVALAAQFLVFEIAVLWLGWFYRLPGQWSPAPSQLSLRPSAAAR